MTFKQHEQIRNLVGTELNELEYIDHIVIMNDTTFFYVIHLNGNVKLLNALDYIINL